MAEARPRRQRCIPGASAARIGWVPTGDVAPLSWKFLVSLVLASEIYGILSSSMWEKIIVGRTMDSTSPSETSCIVSSSLMCTARSGDLKYSESPSLPTKLAADMTSLSGLADGLGGMILPFFCRAQFEFILLPPTVAGVEVSGASVLVISWTAWTVLA